MTLIAYQPVLFSTTIMPCNEQQDYTVPCYIAAATGALIGVYALGCTLSNWYANSLMRRTEKNIVH